MLSLTGKPVAALLAETLKKRAAAFKKAHGRAPHLSVVLVGEDPASHLYVRNKQRVAEKLGISQKLYLFNDKTTASEMKSLLEKLNGSAEVDGILIQRPLPREFRISEVSLWINPEKDVDAFHPELLGKLALGIPALAPCTPSGILALLSHYSISLEGKNACVIGRSPIVGKPLSYMLLNSNATVTQCHSKTENLSAHTRSADLLFVASGIPRFIGREHVKPGAVVIDVGIHRNPSGGWTGDVRAEELPGLAYALSPVPGGVGPLTIMKLMENVLVAAEARLDTALLPSVRKP